ncbi:hypothetical protein [Streptomyces sp. NPDC054783]
MARELREAGVSRSSIHDAFSSTRLPQWHVVDALIEILASKAPGLTVEQQLGPVHALWLRAAEAEQRPVARPTQNTTVAENRTILLFDIEHFSDRDDVEQAYLRRALYDIADRMLAAAGIDETRRQREDRGDSVMEIIDPSASALMLLQVLLSEMPHQLRAINRMASSSAQFKLRGVLATGHVALNEHNGWVGSDLNHACRLLDAQFLRDALREPDNDFALCLSDSMYQGTVRHGHLGIPPASFHRVAVNGKDGQVTAWLTTPV